jgi:hypothetical protein
LQALHTYLRTVREFAAYLGVSRGSVTDVIKRQGVFKQACPSTKRATPAQAGGSSRR